MTEAIRNQDELIHLLNSLIALDYDAIEAYDAAVERLQGTDKQQLAAFAADHRRHISALTPAVSSRGGVPAQHADFKRILTKGKVVFGGLMGDKQVLEAMKSNEDTTNKKYEEARQAAWKELSDLLDLLSLVIDEVDHLAVERRQLGETFLQNVASLALIHRNRGSVRRVLDDFGGPLIELRPGAPPAFRDGPETSDGHQPSRDLRPSLEFVRVSPSVEKHLVDDVLRDRFVAGEARDEAAEAVMMTHIEQLDGALVFAGHQSDQRFVRELARSRYAGLGRCVEVCDPVPHIRLPSWRR